MGNFDFWNWCKEYFTPETITVITTVILLLVALLKLVSVIKKLKKEQHTTLETVEENLKVALTTQNKEELNNAINNVVNPIKKDVEEIKPYLEAFAKILALSQENTPQSRVAILDVLANMGKTDNALLETTRETIQEEVIETEKKKLEKVEKLDKIIKPIE